MKEDFKNFEYEKAEFLTQLTERDMFIEDSTVIPEGLGNNDVLKMPNLEALTNYLFLGREVKDTKTNETYSSYILNSEDRETFRKRTEHLAKFIASRFIVGKVNERKETSQGSEGEEITRVKIETLSKHSIKGIPNFLGEEQRKIIIKESIFNVEEL